MKMNTNILKCRCLFLLILFFSVLTACNNDDDYAGDEFKDVPESYILDRSTKRASTLPGKGIESNPYLIRNASELLYFAEQVNLGKLKPIVSKSRNYEDENGDIIYERLCVKLMHDIEISEEYNWIPIGTDKSPFKGDFDGNGYKITGTLNICLSVSNNDGYEGNYNCATGGFFGFVAGTYIKNFDISADVKLQSLNYEDKNLCIGAFAGNGYGTIVFQKCSYSGIIDISMPNKFNFVTIGGFMGWGGSYEDCTIFGDIKINPTKSNQYAIDTNILAVGGLTGRGSEITTYKNCKNYANIEINQIQYKKNIYIGGIVGNNYSSWELGEIIENYGNITANNFKCLGEDNSIVYIGGLYGYAQEKGRSGSKNLNEGRISASNTGPTYIGGLGGLALGSFIGGCNKGNILNDNKNGYTGGCYGYLNEAAADLSNFGEVRSECDVNTMPYGHTGGIAGVCYQAIHRSCNMGNVFTSCGVGDYGHGPVSMAGAIVGGGTEHQIPAHYCCSNSGMINGETLPHPGEAMLNGYIWLGWTQMWLDTPTLPERDLEYWRRLTIENYINDPCKLECNIQY